MQPNLEKYPHWKKSHKNDAAFFEIQKDIPFLTRRMYAPFIENSFCLLAFNTWVEVESHYEQVHGDDSTGKKGAHALTYAATYDASGKQINENT